MQTRSLLTLFIRNSDKLHQVSDGIVSAEVYLRLDKDQDRENKLQR
jgi:hypothetical protein